MACRCCLSQAQAAAQKAMQARQAEGELMNSRAAEDKAIQEVRACRIYIGTVSHVLPVALNKPVDFAVLGSVRLWTGIT